MNDELQRKCLEDIEAAVPVARPGPPMAYFEHLVLGEMKRVIYETVSYAGEDVEKLVRHTTEKVVEAIKRIESEHGYGGRVDDDHLVLVWRTKPSIGIMPPGFIVPEDGAEIASENALLYCRMRLALHNDSFTQFSLGPGVVKPEGQAMDVVT
jgi:hypothetical protein